jgi:hypothetical protein
MFSILDTNYMSVISNKTFVPASNNVLACYMKFYPEEFPKEILTEHGEENILWKYPGVADVYTRFKLKSQGSSLDA